MLYTWTIHLHPKGILYSGQTARQTDKPINLPTTRTWNLYPVPPVVIFTYRCHIDVVCVLVTSSVSSGCCNRFHNIQRRRRRRRLLFWVWSIPICLCDFLEILTLRKGTTFLGLVKLPVNMFAAQTICKKLSIDRGHTAVRPVRPAIPGPACWC